MRIGTYIKSFILTFIIIVFFSFNCSAHKNIHVTKNYGNIKVHFTSGYYFEEANKALIIGQYAEDLCRKLAYKNDVTLFFVHTGYTNYSLEFVKDDKSSDKKLFLKMEDNNFQVEGVLKYLEYVIQNKKLLEKKDGLNDFNISELKKSEAIKQTLYKKIYRPNIVNQLLAKSGVSYFYQDNDFHIITGSGDKERVLLKLKDIFQYSVRDEYSVLIFDTNKSFYYFTNRDLDKPVELVSIINEGNYYMPYRVYTLSRNKTSISFMPQRTVKEERVMIYLYDEKRLIQNINSIID